MKLDQLVPNNQSGLFCVKCIFQDSNYLGTNNYYRYIERLVLLNADNADHALFLAEENAMNYANDQQFICTDYISSYKLDHDDLEFSNEVEIFLKDDYDQSKWSDYIGYYYDTGRECVDSSEIDITEFISNIRNQRDNNVTLKRDIPIYSIRMAFWFEHDVNDEGDWRYEERIISTHASDASVAKIKAEDEAFNYALRTKSKFIGISGIYEVNDSSLDFVSSKEIYSLTRYHEFKPQQYFDYFYNRTHS